MHEVQSTLEVGHVLRGQYKIIDVLGEGALGTVYLVEDKRHAQKQFVIKEVMHAVREERTSSPFDAAALKRLNHPALPDIQRVFSGENNDRFYILTNYVEGSNLEEVRQLMPGKRFSLHTALTLMSPVMDAMSYLHQQQPHLVHGDIKPSNIIVPLAGTTTPTKLVDFGGVNTVKTDTSAQASMLNYRAPEQFGRKSTRRTDVYGLAATFYTLLSGAVPVSASDRLACIDKGEPDPLLPVNQVNPFVQPVVSDTIMCAMSLSRHERYSSVEHFRSALWQVMHSSDMRPQALDFSAVIPALEQTRAEAGPDSAKLVTQEFPALIAYALMQADMATADATSGPLPAPPLPDESPSSGVIRRKRLGVADTVGAHGSSRRRKRKPRRFSRLVLSLLLLCVIGSGVAISAYQVLNATYQSDVALAQTGTKHLQTALNLMQAWSKNPLDAVRITHAQDEFVAASAIFTRLETVLQSSPGVGSSIPGYSARLNTAIRIIPVAMEIAQAGVSGCKALTVIIARLHEPFGTGNGITLADLSEVGTDFHQVEANINLAIDQVKSLQPGDLQFDARIDKAVALFHQYLPSLQAFLHQADQLLPVLPALIGVSIPAYYLVEILDSTQLRPGGGFIKDYGFATLIGGRLNAAHISDSNLLDTHFANTGQTIPYPPQYRWFDLETPGNSFNLRDSNLDADFPTAARFAKQNYDRENGRAPIQGVIALTTTLMENALRITGPIPISAQGVHETVTAQNLVARIHFYQLRTGSHGGTLLAPGGNASGSRYFTELLGQQFLARIHHIRAAVVPQLFQMLVSSLRTKDLQIYLNAPPAESLLGLSHLDATIPPSTGDTLFVVDANIAVDTANQFITNTMNDQVTIDGSGNATHHTTLRYAWSMTGDVIGSPVYRDYARIYVPPGSSLQEQQGWQQTNTSQAFGHEVWAGSFTLSHGQTNTITLTWTEKGVAKKDAAGWHYRYLVQRQAGVLWTLNMQVTLPACVVKTYTTGGFIAHQNQVATLTTSLTGDTNLGIDYRC